MANFFGAPGFRSPCAGGATAVGPSFILMPVILVDCALCLDGGGGSRAGLLFVSDTVLAVRISQPRLIDPIQTARVRYLLLS